MAHFSIKKEELALIIDKYFQTPKLADDVEYLKNKGGIDWLLESLKTNSENGIDPDTIDARRKVFGAGIDRQKGVCERFLKELMSYYSIGMIFVALFAIFMATEEDYWKIDLIEPSSTICLLLIFALGKAINDDGGDKKKKLFNAVLEENKMVKVIRNGETMSIKLAEVVTGDICDITYGMEIPGDGIVIEGHDLEADESAITLQTEPMHKSSINSCYTKMQEITDKGKQNLVRNHEFPSPILVSGTKITNGEGKMVILFAGKDSCVRKVMENVVSNSKCTYSKSIELDNFAENFNKFGQIVYFLTFVILIIRVLITYVENKSWSRTETNDLINGVLVIGIGVGGLIGPGSLELAIELILLFSAGKMLKDRSLVKKLDAG